MEEAVTLFTECLCFRYATGYELDATSPPDGTPLVPGTTFGPIEDGGYIEDVGDDGKCENGIRMFQTTTGDPSTPTPPEYNEEWHRYS
jgi:hypothetical protein